MKIDSINFNNAVAVPNLKNVTFVTAAPNLQDRFGFDIDLDESRGIVTITANRPTTERDLPICIFRENIASFRPSKVTPNQGKK